MDRLVVDTNCLIQSISKKSKYHDFWLSLFDGRNILCVSNEILEEYQEIIERKTSPELAGSVINIILANPYTEFISPYFHFDLIVQDPDDNKFVDCAVTANAKFIVSNDRHLDILHEIDFPKVDVVTLEQMVMML